MSDYCAAVMLYLFNPMLDSLRSLQRVLELDSVAKALGIRRFSLGSFSESVRLFDPQHLKLIVQELAGELVPLSRDPRLSQLRHALTLVDSSVLAGLCRLSSAACAEMRYCTSKDGRALHGWRLHMQLDLVSFCPHKTELTGARKSGAQGEIPGAPAVPGAGSLLCGRRRLRRPGVVRRHRRRRQQLRHPHARGQRLWRAGGAVAEPGGVGRQRGVGRGRSPGRGKGRGHESSGAGHHCAGRAPPRRTRKIQPGSNKSTRYSEVLLIATNLTDLPAELVALIYRYRYSVELFFRLFKQLLGLRHLLSQRKEGVEIQVYCCVIACMLINLQTGKKPNKAMVQMLGFYLLGLASEEEVVAHLNKPDNTGVKLNAKRELWKKLGY